MFKMPIFVAITIIGMVAAYPYSIPSSALRLPTLDPSLYQEIHKVSDSDAEESRGRFLTNYGFEEDLDETEGEDVHREQHSLSPVSGFASTDEDVIRAYDHAKDDQAEEGVHRERRSLQEAIPEYFQEQERAFEDLEEQPAEEDAHRQRRSLLEVVRGHFQGQEQAFEDLEEQPAEEEVHRKRRSLQPGAPDYGSIARGGGQRDRPYGLDVQREGQNTRVTANAQHKGEHVDVDGQWSKVVRGPGKSKPEWRVGVRG